MIKYLFIVLFFAPTLFAQTLKLNIYYVRGPSAIKKNQLETITATVIETYKNQLDIDLLINKLETIKNPFKRFQFLKRRKFLINAWYKYFYKKDSQNRDINLVILPPLTRPNKSLWFAGYAAATCAFDHYIPVAYVAGYFKNSVLQTNNLIATGITHELGHLLGAEHDPALPKTIMHPDPLSTLDTTGPLNFSQKSKRQIHACLDKRESH